MTGSLSGSYPRESSGRMTGSRFGRWESLGSMSSSMPCRSARFGEASSSGRLDPHVSWLGRKVGRLADLVEGLAGRSLPVCLHRDEPGEPWERPGKGGDGRGGRHEQHEGQRVNPSSHVRTCCH